MSVGIITHHAAHNYGAMLQAFSLQKYLKCEYNLEVKEIDFATQAGIDAYAILKKPKNAKQYIWFLFRLLHYQELNKRHKAFEDFLENYIEKTKRYSIFKELLDSPPDFDIYISGSDQVFSPKGRELRAHYLDFGSDQIKRIAYAPSFGYKSIPKDKKAEIANLLQNFDHLSAREVSGCNVIKELTGKDVPNVIDPVFLLSVEEYRKISNPIKFKYREYILCYSLVGIKKQLPLARRLKAVTGLPIVLINPALLPLKGIDKIIRSAGPREFLWLFDHANFVVTDSFHGTAFSLVFRKNFFSTIALPEKAERLYSILKETGLDNRIIDKPEEITDGNLFVDYKQANRKIDEKIRVSKEYLENALKW